ncbi:MAG TPA: nucleotidyltransferase domain-containing protein [Saprospiraceae bacterium]|nr:nucleotidyltransferase domain-containing protein [Saprospiraceae bacterium]HMQ82077.1 nucleotidyltransferase domain-containing protein [Saprospiraceae bacterium]
MEKLELAIEFLQSQIPELIGVYLFGSYADGSFHAESDVDLAYLTSKPEKHSATQIWEWRLQLTQILNRSVDLVDLQASATDFRFLIVSLGKRIYTADVYQCDTFDMIAISMYQHFELERADLVKAIKERGYIYGR